MFTEAEMRRMEREDAARLEELGGAPAAAVQVNFLSHELEPLRSSEPHLPVADLMVNVICIPTGLHLVEGTRWHPTGERYEAEVGDETIWVTRGRQVPNLVTTEAALASVIPKPSRVEPGQSVVDRGSNTKEDGTPIGPALVTAQEIAMARAEARAMRNGSNVVPFKRWGLTREQRRAIMDEPD